MTETVLFASIGALREIVFVIVALLVLGVVAVEIGLFRRRRGGSEGDVDEH